MNLLRPAMTWLEFLSANFPLSTLIAARNRVIAARNKSAVFHSFAHFREISPRFQTRSNPRIIKQLFPIH